MTANQIAYWRAVEDRRHNQTTERETHRSNRAQERETNRSNVAREIENTRHNTATEMEANRSNYARERETHRANTQSEYLKQLGIVQDKRANDIRTAELAVKQQDADARMISAISKDGLVSGGAALGLAIGSAINDYRSATGWNDYVKNFATKGILGASSTKNPEPGHNLVEPSPMPKPTFMN